MSADSSVGGALAVARLRAIRTRLLSLHKALLDAEQRRYQSAVGPIDGPQHALTLVMRDPWFAWLKPIGDLIVRIDEVLAAEGRPERSIVEAFQVQVRDLLLDPASEEGFTREYRRSLQQVPEVVVAHGQLSQLLDEFGVVRRADGGGAQPTA